MLRCHSSQLVEPGRSVVGCITSMVSGDAPITQPQKNGTAAWRRIGRGSRHPLAGGRLSDCDAVPGFEPERAHRLGSLAYKPLAGSPGRRRAAPLFITTATAGNKPRCTAAVQQHAATFFAHAENAAGADLAQFVKDEFDALLECGILAHSFLRLRCSDLGARQVGRLQLWRQAEDHCDDAGATGDREDPLRTWVCRPERHRGPALGAARVGRVRGLAGPMHAAWRPGVSRRRHPQRRFSAWLSTPNKSALLSKTNSNAIGRQSGAVL